MAADKEIMKAIEALRLMRPERVLTALVEGQTLSGNEATGLIAALRELAVTYRAEAELWSKSGARGWKSSEGEALLVAQAVDEVAAQLDNAGGGAALSVSSNGPRLPVEQCMDDREHGSHDWLCGPVDQRHCLGVRPPADLSGLDALIADSAAEGRGQLREAMVSERGQEVRAVVDAAFASPDVTDPDSAEALGLPITEKVSAASDVAAYLKGEIDTLPGLAEALVPGSVVSPPEAGNPFDTHTVTIAPDATMSLTIESCCEHMLSPGEDPRPWCDCDAGQGRDFKRPHAGPCKHLAHLRKDHDAVTPSAFVQAVESAGVPLTLEDPTVPLTWESETMSADGHVLPGVAAQLAGMIPPAPLLGQPGDGGVTYDPKYIPPGGVPFTFAELMTPVPAAALPAHLSHSQGETLGECPAKYRMQRLDRAPVIGGPVGHGTPIEQIPQWALIGGGAFHAAVEGYELDRTQGEQTSLRPDNCEAIWKIYFDDECAKIEANSPVPRALWRASKRGAEGETWWNANGPEMLRKYLAARPAEPTMGGVGGVPCIEAELQVDVPTGTGYGVLPYKAILDRATVRLDGTIVIRDYKTGATMPGDADQLAEQAWTLALHSGFTAATVVPGSVFGTYFNARKGTWTEPVDLFAEYPWDWFVYKIVTDHARKLALTTGPTPAHKTSFCGGCSVKWACPVGGPKR